MQTTYFGDVDEAATLMICLLKAAKLEHRVVFKADKSKAVASGMLYTCWVEVPEAAMNGGWMKIESLVALAQYVAKYAK